MRKGIAITLLIVAIAVLIGVLIWGIAARGSWGGFAFWNDGSFEIQNAGDIGLRAQEEYSVSDVQAVYASVLSPRIFVSQAEGDKVGVRVLSGVEDPKIRITKEGGTVRIEDPHVPRMVVFGCSGEAGTRIEITLPKTFAGELTLETASGDIAAQETSPSTLSVGTASGNVRLSGIRTDRLDASSASGDFELLNVQAAHSEISSTSGSIAADGEMQESMNVFTTSGDITLDGTFPDLTVSTTSGEVSVMTDRASRFEGGSVSGDISFSCRQALDLESISASTTSGEISVRVPEGTDMNVDFDSVSGELRTDDSADGVRFGGSKGIPVVLSTTSGDARIGTFPASGA